MSKARLQTSAPEQVARKPIAQTQAQAPEQQSGPLPGARAVAAAPPPPGGHPSAARAADLLMAPQRGPGATPRARAARTLQRSAGNSRLSRLSGAPVQAKLTVGAPDDVHEQEAERTADRVMRMAGPPVVASPIPMSGRRSALERDEGDSLAPPLARQADPGAHPVIQRRVEGQPAASDGTFAIESSAATTVPVGSKVDYSLVQRRPTLIGAGSRYHYQWLLENDPATFAAAVRRNPRLQQTIVGPQDAMTWSLWAHFPGTHRIHARVLLDDQISSQLRYEQTVTESGASPELIDLVRRASSTRVYPGVREWTTADIVRWKSPIGGDPNYIHSFKRQWVRGYRGVIKAAAAAFDLPELLVAGVAYAEVGGDPAWIDDIAYGVRSVDHLADPTLEPLTVTREPQQTSFGNVSMQLRRAAETVGLDPQKITGQQEQLLIAALKDPKINIFIAAKHLAELRDLDFKGKGATSMTLDEIKITTTRFNRGPDLSLQRIRQNQSYGESIIRRAGQISQLLAD